MGDNDENNEVDSADVFNILIASDIHLGYNEKDPVRESDSYVAFEEILAIGEQRKVDMIILGGDLFHDTKPSQKCLHQAISLLRRYCMGERPVSIRFLSDQAENFQHCLTPVVNYMDPNLNISTPVFSIHGNHDDPSGIGRLSSLDLLSISGLVNYFGKWTDLTNIDISPLLMQKGETKLALYGLSYIKDERLCRLFRDRKVNFYRPEEALDDWFNIFVTHQNRADRGMSQSLPEWALPNFLDLVIWGHEHECRIQPEKNQSQGFYVMQPGSPVATSLCEGESVPKHVAIIKVYKKKFEPELIKLKTVRPFVMDTVVLSKSNIKYISDQESEAVQAFLRDLITTMIEKSRKQISGHPKQPQLPLIRLRVEYSDDVQTFNPIRFGQSFFEEVANPNDMILLRRERKGKPLNIKQITNFDKDTLNELMDRFQSLDKTVECVIENYFAEREPLSVLSIKGLSEGMSAYVEKADNEALDCVVAAREQAAVEFILKKLDGKMGDWKETLRMFRESATEEEDLQQAKAVLNAVNRSQYKINKDDNDDVVTIDDNDNDSDEDFPTVPKSGGSRGRARGARGGRAPRGGGPGSRGGRGARARGRGQTNGQTSISSNFSSNLSSRRPSTSDTSQRSRKAVTYIPESDSNESE